MFKKWIAISVTLKYIHINIRYELRKVQCYNLLNMKLVNKKHCAQNAMLK